MNHQEKYNLTWHTYSSHLRSMLQNMLEKNYQNDVTLVCDDNKAFKAHKIVLSACSPMLENIINNCAQENHPIIYIKGIQHQEMESLLEFMYLGDATFYQDRMNEFLDAAKHLKVKEISQNLEIQDDDDETVDRAIDSGMEVTTDISTNQEDQHISETNLEPQPLQKDKKHQCSQCDYQTKNKFDFKKHVDAVHEGIKHKCSSCEKTFSDKSNLKKHIQSLHEGIRYKCNQCDKEYTENSNLMQHIQSDHGGVRYSCDQCDQQFKTAAYVRQHAKSVHDGLRRYECQKCDKKFTYLQKLKIHSENIHEGVKYSCNQCEKVFNLKNCLYRHTGCPTKNDTLFWRAISPLNFELGIKVGGVLESSGSQL